MPRTKPLPRMASVQTLERLALAGADYRDWYAWAASDILQAAKRVPVSPSRMTDLLALYSPRVSVKRSIRMVLHQLRTGQHAHDVVRSTRAAVDHWKRTGEIRGPKTLAFSRALRDYPGAVVLDVWMARAFRIDPRQFARPKVYTACADRVRIVGQRLDWEPRQAQAAIWSAVVQQQRRTVPVMNVLAETQALLGAA